MRRTFVFAVLTLVALVGCGAPKCKVPDHAVLEVLKTELKVVQTERDALKAAATTVDTVEKFKDKLVNVETEFKALNEQVKADLASVKTEREELIRQRGILEGERATVAEEKKKQQEWKNGVAKNLEAEIRQFEEEWKKMVAEMDATQKAYKEAEEQLARLGKETPTLATRDAIRRQQTTLVNRNRDFQVARQRAQIMMNAQMARFRSMMPQ